MGLLEFVVEWWNFLLDVDMVLTLFKLILLLDENVRGFSETLLLA